MVATAPSLSGEILFRLTSKCLSSAVADEAAAFLSPHQLGVKVRGGCEAIIHATSTIFNSTTPLHDRCILQIDFENAFNNIDRTLFLRETRKHFPKLSSWAAFSYGAPSFLLYRGRRILSSVGARQGDPMASPLFALGLQLTVKKIQANVPSLVSKPLVDG